MKKPNYLFEHFQNPRFRDPKSAILPETKPQRLCLDCTEIPGNWHTLATVIRGLSGQNVHYFPDANIAFRPDTDVMWDALRTAGLGIAGGVTALTPVALAEMRAWLSEPHHLKDRAEKINAAIQDGTWLRTIQKPGFPYDNGIWGYVHLLAYRRSLAGPLANGSTFVGTQAADKCETLNAIRNGVGPRAENLAKKGRIDLETKGNINASDELHCLIVIANALLTGEESVIVTADVDFIEVFWKAIWLLDTHYRAWSAAKLVKNGDYGDALGTVDKTSGFFKGPLTLYRRPTDHLREVLPSVYEPVRISVAYVTPHGQIQMLAFNFERQMLEVFKIRGVTNGRCTDLFGLANIHIDLGPLLLGLKHRCFGIGEDEGVVVESMGHKNFLPKLDIVHCIHCKERYAS